MATRPVGKGRARTRRADPGESPLYLAIAFAARNTRAAPSMALARPRGHRLGGRAVARPAARHFRDPDAGT